MSAAAHNSAPAPTHDDAANANQIAWEQKQIVAARRVLRAYKTPNPRIYYTDFTLSYVILMCGFGCALFASAWWLQLLGFLTAGFAGYRCLIFMHEIIHLDNNLPGFKAWWNTLFGLPFMIPAYLYRAHLRHHAADSYASPHDPEYRHFPEQGFAAALRYLIQPFVLPIALLVRFAIIAPLAVVSPATRRFAERWASMLTMNFPMEANPALPTRRQDVALELGICLYVYAVIGLLAWGVLPVFVITTAYAIGVFIQLLNLGRAMVAHRYVHNHDASTPMSQFNDSLNHPSNNVLNLIWAPVGLRFHALHHLAPMLPYHAMPAAHAEMTRQFDWYATAADTPILDSFRHMFFGTPPNTQRAAPFASDDLPAFQDGVEQ